MKRVIVALSLLICACGGSSPAPSPSPTPTTQTPPPSPTPTPTPSPTYTVFGKVTDGTSGGVLPNIVIAINDGAGKSATTNASGDYTMTGVSKGTFTLTASATSYDTTTKTVTVSADIRVDVVLVRTPPKEAQLAISTTANKGWTSIAVTINGRVVGTLTKLFEPGGAASCVAVPDARIVATVQPGTIAWSARSDKGTVWSGSQPLGSGACYEVQLTCTNRDCSAAPAPTPTPTPSPSPSPTPSPTPGALLLYGGTNNRANVFVGCLNCNRFDSSSVCNQFGDFGSRFADKSIWNRFGDYGSRFSDTSPWNKFASSAPKIVDAAGNFYGYFTSNRFLTPRTTDRFLLSFLDNVDTINNDLNAARNAFCQ